MCALLPLASPPWAVDPAAAYAAVQREHCTNYDAHMFRCMHLPASPPHYSSSHLSQAGATGGGRRRLEPAVHRRAATRTPAPAAESLLPLELADGVRRWHDVAQPRSRRKLLCDVAERLPLAIGSSLFRSLLRLYGDCAHAERDSRRQQAFVKWRLSSAERRHGTQQLTHTLRPQTDAREGRRPRGRTGRGGHWRARERARAQSATATPGVRRERRADARLQSSRPAEVRLVDSQQLRERTDR